ncbi:MAG TPA: amino acid adenylation domain-containing protein, partial [Thermoanaerobaculia bacterium]|nr:amino acid adenylation domain-containing protein [Thermoanaerobaculia bacterium]
GPTEELLAGVWAEVLGVERVGARDDFFALGGHSLLATQVASRIRAVIGVELPLRRLFEAPTVAALALAVHESREGRQAPPIVPVPREGDLPLSFAQQRLWLLDQLEPGSAVYNIPLAVRLAGELQPGLLQRVFTGITRRHEALRTTFASREGRPVQVIAPPQVVELPVIDLSGVGEPEALKLVRDEARRPFDLGRGPLLRLTLLLLGARDHVLLMTMHHIVSDGWSMGVLLREIAAFYESRPLPGLAVQYADFAAWQRSWLQGEVLEEQLAYWTRQLAGAPRVLELPLDRPRPAVQTFRGASRRVVLPPELSAAVQTLCRREGATPFMALLASWAAVLGRHAGQEDVLVGTPIAGRNRREIEGLIGFFINTLVLRVDLSGGRGFAGMLARVRQSALDGYTHQDVPFERLVEELVPERDLAHSPLFQVLLTLQNAPAAGLSVPGLTLAPLPIEIATTKFDLSLSLQEGAEGFGGALSYNVDLFDGATVARLWARFTALLEAAVASPEIPVSELPLLLPEERHQALVEWNDSARPYASVCLHELFDRQARNTPDAVAVSFEDQALSYGELERRANRLAHHLIGLGVEPDGRVGVSMERSPELIVALLGVLKAGAAYVPLDPSYPAERLATLVAGSGARVVLTRESWKTGTQPDTAPAVEVAADGLAYVLFTSGSTGTPKGVMVPHRGIVNRLLWEQETFALTPADRLLQKTPFTFDVSVWEVFWPLLHGACLVLARPDGHKDPAYLAGLIARERLTVVHFVPSMLQAFLEVEAPDLSSVRLVMAGGEALPVELVRRLSARVPQAGMHNRYGPTEASVSVSVWACEPDSVRAISPIGRPVANLRLYVVDRELRPQPLGVPGELLLGGAGLARGYLGRPELTAAAFVPDPLGDGERLYRTGDLARTLPDGTVEFLGRIDHQVKVRGFRIELGEIEAVLASHPAVRECAVVVREVLVAYVTGTSDTAALRSFLGARLPEYMVPAVFVVLDSLPLMSSGKVDRKALPAPEISRSEEREAGDPIEELLAGIWSEVLGLERVGIEDDFFALGGHSLLATQVVSRVRAVLGVELPLRQLFEAPTVAGLARAARESREGRQAPPITPVPREGELPLSFAQQRLWLLDQIEPGSPAYNIPVAMRLTGELPPGLLARIFTEIVRRHEALRTTFTSREGRPAQVIAAPRFVELPVIDLSAVGEPEALQLVRAEAGRPFDLQRRPLLRLALLRLGARDHVLLMTMHHIVSDGWSMGVLLREVAALYGGSSLPELAVQYADFAVWQREWLQGEVLEARLSYWRQQLAGAPRLLELPLDRPRPALQTFRGASRRIALPPELSEAVHGLCRREGATPFMVLLAAWAALLGHHAGQEDVLLGTPIAGRNRREIESLIGFFVNTLVLRTDPASPPDFTALVRQVRGTALDAYTHQDVPFERLVEELVPERDLSHSPLFQAMFVLQNVPVGSLSLPGLVLTPLDTDSGTAQFDLTLTLQERRDGVFLGGLEHNTDLFDGSTAARLWGRFTALLEAAVAGPGLPLSELSFLPPAERHQALMEWNDTARAYAPGLCLHERVARQARQADGRPDAVAVSFEGRDLSYGELERRANRLARHLIGLGVRPEDRVGLLLERSLEMVVGVLGVLKAGAAYVPLDPGYPAERLKLLVEESGVRVVLTAQSFEEVADRPDTAPAVETAADNLAYVLFTSGSTGRPKGVMVPHRGVVNRLVWGEEVYRVEPEDVVLQKAPFSFDISVWEIFAPLLAGARLVLAEPGGHRDAAYLARAIAEHRVTLVDFVPSMLAAFLEEPGLERCISLRQVFTGGDALSPALRDRYLERLAGVPLDNQYGPTEISIDTARWICRPGPVSIGRPIANARLYVADRRLRPLPPGVAGELLIGGAGVTRGYLGRPDLTASAFVPDAFGAEAGGRIYRTGDLARLRPDGEVEFLGRVDHQVKVRGFRIELGEIEAVLASHPGVRECAVMVREDVPGVHRLAAYVTGGADTGELRAFLAERLPEYMVPAVFVPLEALPLSPAGKVDRRALSASAAPERMSFGEGHVAPSDPVEELLAGIWSEVLGLERVGAYDDFFVLGGHSLLATQVVSRIRAVFGVELPLRRLFESPTLAELGRAVRESRTDPAVPPIVPVPREGDLPLSFAQQRLWFLDQLAPGGAVYNMPLAVRLTGEVEPARLARIFAAIVRRHEALRTTFTSREGRPVQRIAAPRVELPVLDLSQADEREALRLAREEAERPFDLERGPLLRLALLRLGEQDHVLLMTMHHIVSDGWSMGVLLREVVALYEGLPLPELGVQYADFAVWQRRWLHGEVLEAQLAYWRRQLADAPRVLELPTDQSRPAVQTFRGASLPLRLPARLSERVRALGRREGATSFMTLLAAWSALLVRHTGQPEVLVGTPIAGRNRSEIEGLIGFFVNTLALRADLSDAPGFGTLLGRVRRTALDAYTHQDLPFDRLVEELVPERDLSRSPLFQVMFTLQNAAGERLDLPGLTLAPIAVESRTTKFDLTLALQEHDGGFDGEIEYNTDLFDAGTAARLRDRFAVLLEGAVGDPGLAFPELPLLPPAERQQALLEWNDAWSGYPRESSLLELFAAVARSIPEAPAVVA